MNDEIERAVDRAGPASQAVASARTMTGPSGRPARSSSRFSAIVVAARRSRSTNVARAAPRDSASIPAAPLPAHRSRNAAPGRSGSRIANSVCLTRSASGRVPSPGATRRRPAGRPGDDPPGVSHRGPLRSRRALRLDRRRSPRASPRSSSWRSGAEGRIGELAGLVEERLGMAPGVGRRGHDDRPAGATRRGGAAARSGPGRGHRPPDGARSRPRPARTRRASGRRPRGGPARWSRAPAARRPARARRPCSARRPKRARRTRPRSRGRPGRGAGGAGRARTGRPPGRP